MESFRFWSSPVVRKDVLILSAGASSRMGSPKALLSFDGRENFLQHLLRLYRSKGFRIVLVIPARLARECAIGVHAGDADVLVINNHVELGRMHSVRAGLARVRPDAHIMIQDIDRPFITSALIDAILKAQTTFGYTAPIFTGAAGHPVLLSPQVARSLRYDASPTLRHALRPFPRREVPWHDPRCNANINTPADYVRHGVAEEDCVA